MCRCSDERSSQESRSRKRRAYRRRKWGVLGELGLDPELSMEGTTFAIAPGQEGELGVGRCTEVYRSGDRKLSIFPIP